MFPALMYLKSLAPVRVKTETGFTAEDPWNGNRRTPFTLEAYIKTYKGLAPRNGKIPKGAVLFYGVRSELDGVERMLPSAMSELWAQKRVATEALPRLVNAMEPILKKADYGPPIRARLLTVLSWFLWLAMGILILVPPLLFSDGTIALPAAAVSTVALAGIAWLYMYLVFYRRLWRRKRQIQWILAQQ
jgi:hypothetical protein